MSDSAGDTLDEILEHGDEADDVLRRVVELLTAQPGVAWAGFAFLEGSSLSLGPNAGTPDESVRGRTAILYDGSLVGELWVDGRADEGFLTRIAASVSPYVLIGWDTQGQTWEP